MIQMETNGATSSSTNGKTFEELNGLSRIRFAMRVQIIDEMLSSGAVPLEYEEKVREIRSMVAALKADTYGTVLEKYRVVPQ
jgi:hypothetical protein